MLLRKDAKEQLDAPLREFSATWPDKTTGLKNFISRYFNSQLYMLDYSRFI